MKPVELSGYLVSNIDKIHLKFKDYMLNVHVFNNVLLHLEPDICWDFLFDNLNKMPLKCGFWRFDDSVLLSINNIKVILLMHVYKVMQS